MQPPSLSEHQVRLRLYGTRSETVRRLGGQFRRALQPENLAQPRPAPIAGRKDDADADGLTHAA